MAKRSSRNEGPHRRPQPSASARPRCEAHAKETSEILKRLDDRQLLMDLAVGETELSDGACLALQAQASTGPDADKREAVPDALRKTMRVEDVGEATRYRLGITDLFVEKAQYYLERRALWYAVLGGCMYSLAVALFLLGTWISYERMCGYEASLRWKQPPVDVSLVWIDLLSRFILGFTAYGFIVLSGVALVRGARAVLDQRERLLAKRHSLRQGRLFLHLIGGHVTIDEMERAFNWNHSQDNAFTHMPTDAKAPWGAVAEELIKITPELVKTGVATARGTDPRNEDHKEQGKRSQRKSK